MGKTFVHTCDVCGKRIEDRQEYYEPKGWYIVKITPTHETSGWRFLACDDCMKRDENETRAKMKPYFKRVCDFFRGLG